MRISKISVTEYTFYYRIDLLLWFVMVVLYKKYAHEEQEYINVVKNL
jgi:hypothetical protein